MQGSFILSKSGIIGYQVSDLVSDNKSMSFEMKQRLGDQSPIRDDSFFHTGDPN